ncbi:MAG TPA: PASTA domain-containing protein [Acidimicrobiales bacterium]
MQTSDLRTLLQQGADALDVPTQDSRGRVAVRARRLRRRRRAAQILLAGVLAGSAAVGALVALGHGRTGTQTVTVTGSISSVPPKPSNFSASPTVVKMLHNYAHPGSWISGVSRVQLKETAFGAYASWAASQGYPPGTMKIGSPPDIPVFNSDTPIYVIFQVGPNNCAVIHGCTNGHTDWVVTVLLVSDLRGPEELIASGPTAPMLESFSSMPGPEADLDTATGQITSSPSPVGPLPTTVTPPTSSSLVSIPRLVDESVGTARTTLESLGFVVAVEYSTTTVAPQGDVIAETPAAGTIAPAGAHVSLTVSAGPPPVSTTSAR